jgi:hypothetical protein
MVYFASRPPQNRRPITQEKRKIKRIIYLDFLDWLNDNKGCFE